VNKIRPQIYSSGRVGTALKTALLKALALDICSEIQSRKGSLPAVSRGGMTEGHTMRRGIALAIAEAAQNRDSKALAKTKNCQSSAIAAPKLRQAKALGTEPWPLAWPKGSGNTLPWHCIAKKRFPT